MSLQDGRFLVIGLAPVTDHKAADGLEVSARPLPHGSVYATNAPG
jgi:hypothetical protein